MSDKTETPTQAPTPPESTQPPPATAPPSTEPKKRGPKTGSKNIPKDGAIPVPRKRPDQIADTRQAAQRRLEETRAILERHDKEHGTRTAAALPKWDDIQAGKGAPVPPPQMSPEVIGIYLTMGFGLLGETLDVESRPAPESIKAAAAAISDLSSHLPQLSPIATASLAAGGALVICTVPMVMEYKDVKAGKIAPASLRDVSTKKLHNEVLKEVKHD